MTLYLNEVDLTEVTDLGFFDKRDATVATLIDSEWGQACDENSHLVALVEELAETTNEEEFEYWMTEVRDAAERARVWLKTN